MLLCISMWYVARGIGEIIVWTFMDLSIVNSIITIFLIGIKTVDMVKFLKYLLQNVNYISYKVWHINIFKYCLCKWIQFTIDISLFPGILIFPKFPSLFHCIYSAPWWGEQTCKNSLPLLLLLSNCFFWPGIFTQVLFSSFSSSHTQADTSYHSLNCSLRYISASEVLFARTKGSISKRLLYIRITKGDC